MNHPKTSLPIRIVPLRYAEVTNADRLESYRTRRLLAQSCPGWKPSVPIYV